MKNVTVVDLHVCHLEVGSAVNDNIPCIVFLSTRFCVETCAVKDNSKRGRGRDFRGGIVECLVIIDGFHNGIDVSNG